MRSEGFTLMEFIIVFVIVGVLSVIAIPVYKSYVVKIKTTTNIAAIDKATEQPLR